MNPKPLHETKTNWIDKYCKSAPKERVIWDSILYSEWKDFDKKSMYEQVEDLMDIVSVITIFEFRIQRDEFFYILFGIKSPQKTLLSASTN